MYNKKNTTLFLVRRKISGYANLFNFYFATSREAFEFYSMYSNCIFWGETYVNPREYHSLLMETYNLIELMEREEI